MNTRSLLVRLCAALTLTLTMTAGQLGAQVIYNDATGDINVDGNTNPGNGTLDIVSMEVSETATDLVFTLTVNGNISGTDWGNFMIGIANTKLAGTTAANGNGWGRPINMVTPASTGMTHWIGSWVNNGGGSQFWTYNGTSWNGPAALSGYALTPGPQSTITYTVTKASVDYVEGDVLFFDAYASGAEGNPSAVDALSNPNVAITSWGGPYTSSIATGLSRFPQATGVSANITFRVDMNPQITAGNFNPLSDIVEVLPVGNAAFARADMNEVSGQPGVYEITVLATAPQDSSVPFRYNIIKATDQPENLTRTFAMPATATTLTTVFFNNIPGYRQVTFRVDMNAQITSGAFVPATQSVLVAGNFNGFSVDPLVNTPLTDGDSDGVYEGTFVVGIPDGAPMQYKYYTTVGTGSGSGYEYAGDNRSTALELNPGGVLTPAQIAPLAIYGLPFNSRPVTFTVDMALEAAAGRFDPATDGVSVSGSFNSWNTGASVLTRDGSTSTFRGTFNIIGDAASSALYKFVNLKPGAANGGYESGDNRALTLGPLVDPQVLPSAVFGVTASQFRNITFTVDMSVQVALGLFNPDETDPNIGGIVEVRGINGNFDSGPRLTRQGSSSVYSGIVEVGGNVGSTFGYKFWSPGINFYNIPGNTGFEQINLADQYQNRTITLDANGVAMNLPAVFFSNQLFYTVGSAPNAFSTTQGTASAAQSITINGQGLTANIVATAPTGFEVSADGIAYGATANLVPASGTVSGSNNLFIRLAASAAVGSPSGNVALASTGSQPANVAVSGTVTASGQTFNGWSGGLSNTPALQLQYAIGGASSPTATNGVPSVTTVTSNTLSITAVVRTNDPTLTVNGQALVDLGVGPWTTNGVTMTPSAGPAPEGCQVQTFSTPRGTDGKKFLRLQTTLPAAP